MEENNQNKAAEETSQPIDNVETSVHHQPTQEKTVNAYGNRKNRRNRSGSSAKKCDSSATECGEVENIAKVQEKLSGKHISGYEGGVQNDSEVSEGSPRENRGRREDRGERSDRNDRGPRRERGERGERREYGERKEYGERRRYDRSDRGGAEAVLSNDIQNSKETTDKSTDGKEHRGPSFEESQARPRTVDVSLDKRPKLHKKDAPKADFVSYSSAAPKIGIINRIKRLWASMFKKEKVSEPQFKNDRRRDWKNNKGGDRRNGKNSDWKKSGKRQGQYGQHGRHSGKNAGRYGDKGNYKPHGNRSEHTNSDSQSQS